MGSFIAKIMPQKKSEFADFKYIKVVKSN